MTESDEEVGEFLNRMYGASDIETGATKPVDPEHGKGETMDGCNISNGSLGSSSTPKQMFSELGAHRRPLTDISDYQEDGSAHNRRCFRRVSDEAQLVVNRPIPFNATSISFDSEEQQYRLEVQDMEWYNRILERYMDAGYGPRSNSIGNIASILGIFHSLPPNLAEVLKESLHALQVLHAARGMSHRPHADAMPAVESTERVAAMEDAIWEDNDQCGYMRYEWNPTTECRRYSSSALPCV
jgi:hypothetical protein